MDNPHSVLSFTEIPTFSTHTKGTRCQIINLNAKDSIQLVTVSDKKTFTTVNKISACDVPEQENGDGY